VGCLSGFGAANLIRLRSASLSRLRRVRLSLSASASTRVCSHPQALPAPGAPARRSRRHPVRPAGGHPRPPCSRTTRDGGPRL